MISNIIKTQKCKLRSLTILNYIHSHAVCPYEHTFVTPNPLLNLLEQCTSMSQLFQIQSQMITTGLFLDDVASSRLIAFCALSDTGDPCYSHRILRDLDNPIVHSWNYVIKGYSESLNPVKAIDLYREMLVNSSCRPDNYTYPILFQVCARLCSCLMGNMVFGHVLKLGFESDVFVQNGVVHMMASCGKLEHARHMFDEMCERDLVTWNSLINGYVDYGNACEALKLFEEMMLNGVMPDEVTMIGMLESCAQLKDLNRGVEFHKLIWKYGLEFSILLCNALIHMYSKCGDLQSARVIFDSMTNKTSVLSWDYVIRGYSESWIPVEAIVLYKEMLVSGLCRPDYYTCRMLFNACERLCSCLMGYLVFGHVLKLGFESDVFVLNGVVHMLVSCGKLEDARRVFDDSCVRDVFTWISLIDGYVHFGKTGEALKLFEEMRASGVKPDEVTMIGMIELCAQLKDLDRGVEFHQLIREYGLEFTIPLCNALMDMYIKCGDIEEARVIFDSMRKKTSMSWNIMIEGYAEVGMLDEARKLFDETDNKDCAAWNSIIGILAISGFAYDALTHFTKMVTIGLRPDEITFLGVLVACCHAGLVIEGYDYFYQLTSIYNLTPNPRHYSSMVYLFGRAGKLKEAEALIMSMPMKPGADVWGTLYFACRIHGNMEMEEKAARKLLEFDPEGRGIYVMLSGMWNEAQEVWNMMSISGIDKTPWYDDDD
ncbi:pentatricopeptide repeat-containing protein At2g22410, mitochondrial-like [Silene latifolia]|uniref:pentatricopeptide repeat-containing protein At2g22410, mitochondrial-like n=1 Tax=Silene latifolia TaxID=37657 RepID=UPI003D76EE77